MQTTWYYAKKKTTAYKERPEEQRQKYLIELEKLQDSPIVYLDETGIDQYLTRPYARSKKGDRVIGWVSGKRYQRTSIVAALWETNILAPLQYQGTMDSHLFNGWFEDCLLPVLPKNSVIVMDNASFHQKDILHETAEENGHSVLFLPPYSPDFNPIEKTWAWLKGKLRKILPSHASLDDALLDCFAVR